MPDNDLAGKHVWISAYATGAGPLESRIFSVRVELVDADGFVHIRQGDGPPGTRTGYRLGDYHVKYLDALKAALDRIAEKRWEAEQERARLNKLETEYVAWIRGIRDGSEQVPKADMERIDGEAGRV